jgi:hypothetical protein
MTVTAAIWPALVVSAEQLDEMPALLGRSMGEALAEARA